MYLLNFHISFQVFPVTGVNSVSVVLHSHSAASKMKLRHFRQGEELAPIVQVRTIDIINVVGTDFYYYFCSKFEKSVHSIQRD